MSFVDQQRPLAAPLQQVPVDDGAQLEAASQSSAVRVQSAGFDGPFDLLLHLILKDEVDLYEVSLATIVDAYLAEIERMDLCDLESATEFLLIAATLVELKCRRLLPIDDDFDLDDELGLWEERDLLLSRLLECKTFKDAARTIDQLSGAAARSVPRRVGLPEEFLSLAPDLLAGVTPEGLRLAFIKAASPKPQESVALDHVTRIKANVTDAIEELVDELPRSGRVSFRTLTSGLVERLDVVVRFLAVLELFKQGLVEIDQPTVFGDLVVEWVGGEIGTAMALSGADVYEG